MKISPRNFPIETYVFLLPSIISIILSVVFYLNYLSGHIFAIILTYKILIVLLLIIFTIILSYILFILIRKRRDSVGIQIVRLRSFIFIILIQYFFLLASAFVIQILFVKSDPQHVYNVSSMLMDFDMRIFGSYLPFTLNQIITSVALSNAIIWSYFSINTIALSLMMILFFKSMHLFRKYFIAYFIALMIGIPFWIFMPAVAPDFMYRVNIFHKEIPTVISNTVESTTFLPNTKNVLVALEDFWIDEKGESLGITTFPSMHSAWGVIIAYIAIELWAPLAIFVLPWLILELIGTMYVLEHYAVDTLLGIAIGLISVFIAKRLLKFEKKYFIDKYDIFSSLKFMNNKFDKFKELLFKYFKRQ